MAALQFTEREAALLKHFILRAIEANPEDPKQVIDGCVKMFAHGETVDDVVMAARMTGRIGRFSYRVLLYFAGATTAVMLLTGQFKGALQWILKWAGK